MTPTRRPGSGRSPDPSAPRHAIQVDFDVDPTEAETGQAGQRARLAGLILGVFDKLESDDERSQLAELASVFEAAGARRKLVLAVARSVIEN